MQLEIVNLVYNSFKNWFGYEVRMKLIKYFIPGLLIVLTGMSAYGEEMKDAEVTLNKFMKIEVFKETQRHSPPVVITVPAETKISADSIALDKKGVSTAKGNIKIVSDDVTINIEGDETQAVY